MEETFNSRNWGNFFVGWNVTGFHTLLKQMLRPFVKASWELCLSCNLLLNLDFFLIQSYLTREINHFYVINDFSLEIAKYDGIFMFNKIINLI